MKKPLSISWLLMILPALVVAGEPGVESPREVLTSMEAVTGFDYEGVFVLRDGEALESYHVLQRIEDGVAHEKIVSLSGPYREFHRRDDQVICLLPERGLQLTGLSRAMSPLPGPFPHDLDYYQRLESNYRLKVLGEGRVAGRSCDRVGILPRDQYRYARELCIDREFGVLLSSRKYREADDGEIDLVLAKFVRIEFPERIEADRLAAGVDTEGLTTRQRDWRMIDEGEAEPAWRVGELPPGFELSGRSKRTDDGSPRVIEHLVYSDGLASVSLFVGEHSREGGSFTGRSSKRSINVFGAVHGDYHVTAVGEVPEITLEFMVENLEQVRSTHD